MNELRDGLQELADGYASTSQAPGPAAASRRGRWRRRRTVGGLVDQRRQTLENEVEHTTGLSGLDHVRIEVVENLRMLFESSEQR